MAHRITFKVPDPLGDGLREEIIAEQASPDVISLTDEPDGETLAATWSEMVKSLHDDPTWFDFAGDE